MRELLPDYILAGRASDLAKWAQNASTLGILWCYQHERCGGDRCSSACARGGGCAVGEGTCLLNIMPIAQAQYFDGSAVRNFDVSAYEAVFLLTPSKKLKPNDLVAVRAVVSQFVSSFRDEAVFCFESHTNPEGGVVWEAFSGEN